MIEIINEWYRADNGIDPVIDFETLEDAREYLRKEG